MAPVYGLLYTCILNTFVIWDVRKLQDLEVPDAYTTCGMLFKGKKKKYQTTNTNVVRDLKRDMCKKKPWNLSFIIIMVWLVPPDSYVEAQTPSVTLFGDGAFWR